MYAGTTARWVEARLEKIDAVPTGLPSSAIAIPIILFADWVQTDPFTSMYIGELPGAWKVAVMGSGPAWLRITLIAMLISVPSFEGWALRLLERGEGSRFTSACQPATRRTNAVLKGFRWEAKLLL